MEINHTKARWPNAGGNTAGAYVVWDQASESDEREALLKTLRQVHANYQAADEDGDGNLTMLQFRAFIDANAEIDFARARQVKRMRAYRPAFLAVDLNSDGSLSWQEYVTVLRSGANAAR